MLRITDGKTKWFIWFIIISINITKTLSAGAAWVACTPLAKAWDPFLDGTCWDKKTVSNYNLFSAGKMLRWIGGLGKCWLAGSFSLFGREGSEKKRRRKTNSFFLNSL